MVVTVAITLALEDMAAVDGAALGDLVARLRETPGVRVIIHAPTSDELRAELANLEVRLDAARARQYANAEIVQDLQARLDGAKQVNTWIARVERLRT